MAVRAHHHATPRPFFRLSDKGTFTASHNLPIVHFVRAIRVTYQCLRPREFNVGIEHAKPVHGSGCRLHRVSDGGAEHLEPTADANQR